MIIDNLIVLAKNINAALLSQMLSSNPPGGRSLHVDGRPASLSWYHMSFAPGKRTLTRAPVATDWGHLTTIFQSDRERDSLLESGRNDFLLPEETKIATCTLDGEPGTVYVSRSNIDDPLPYESET